MTPIVAWIALATGNAVMAAYHSKEKELFDASLHWFGSGCFFAITLTEVLKFLG